MKNKSSNIWTKRTVHLIVVFAILLVFFGLGGCQSPPRLTAEDRRSDIEFLARWARDCHPCVELNEKYKGTPSYEALLQKYVEFAEQAETDEEFYRVVLYYFSLIGACGHTHPMPDDGLQACAVGSLLGIVDWGISPWQFLKARYWPRFLDSFSIFAHPPFRVISREGRYFTDDEWQYDGTAVPKGSEILKVNGMTCSDYLDFVKTDTVLKYDAYKDEADAHLMIIDEDLSFRGWPVDFRMPDGSDLSAFVPKVNDGRPAPIGAWPGTVETDENCTCIELTNEIAYIRIKSMSPGGLWGLFFPNIYRKDGKIIKSFLENANGKYRKLIIDIRSNTGGSVDYVYDNLIAPFLDEPVTYDQVAGMRRKYRDNLKPSVLKTLRKWLSSRKEHVVNIEEIDVPECFDHKEWVFYRITRRIEPRNRYDFTGNLYILVDYRTFSAADLYADVAKRIGLAKLFGRTTSGGCAAYLKPDMMRLPASGMIFRVETEIVIGPDGSVNELFGTVPDVELPLVNPPKSITRDDLLKDEWIEYIIHEI